MVSLYDERPRLLWTRLGSAAHASLSGHEPHRRRPPSGRANGSSLYEQSNWVRCRCATPLRTFDDIPATRDTLLNGVFFEEVTIDGVTEFMKALTDPAARNLSAITPDRVPSGLPVDRP